MVIALGCPKNRVDSENLLAALNRAGFELTDKPEHSEVAILTTCAFIQPAVDESLSFIDKLIRLKSRRPNLKLVVAGCLVQRFGTGLNQKFPAVNHWVEIDRMGKIPELLGRKPPTGRHQFPRRLLSTPSHYAYLKIADGCENRCSYCLIPKIRGPFRSRPIPELVDEAKELAALGVRELILIAQDTTAYGSDLYPKPALAQLIDRLSQIKGITWIRLMYAHPAHLTEDVVEQFGSNPKLCRYIDLPIQHTSDRILKQMNRHYTRRKLEILINRLRYIPGMKIRTTVITGFPGETPSDFEDLLNFIRTVEFDRLSGYPFSPEPGTQAALMKPQVKPSIGIRRLKTILRVQAAISRKNLHRLLKQELTIVADSPHQGRTEWDAPEIDGVVSFPEKLIPGRFYPCQVIKTQTHDLHARVLSPKQLNFLD